MSTQADTQEEYFVESSHSFHSNTIQDVPFPTAAEAWQALAEDILSDDENTLPDAEELATRTIAGNAVVEILGSTVTLSVVEVS